MKPLRKAALLAALLPAQGAFARAYIATPKAQSQPDVEASPMIGGSAYSGFEAGAKFGWLVANPGFVPVINDSVNIEASAFLAAAGYLKLAPLLMWSFHLNPQWSVYAEAGAELGLAFGKKKRNRDDDFDGPRRDGRDSGFVIGGGGIYRVNPTMALRLEHELETQTIRFGLLFPI